MKTTEFVTGLIFITALWVTSANAEPSPCKNGGPGDAKAAAANFAYCLKSGECDGLHSRVFENRGKVLSTARERDGTYWEARIGADRSGGAGDRRLVFLVSGEAETKNAKILGKYFTNAHYKKGSFCSM